MKSANVIARKALDNILRVSREVKNAIFPKVVSHILYFPTIEKEEDAADIINRANWYFPEKGPSKAQVIIPVSHELFEKVKDFTKLKAPREQGVFISKNKRIRVIPAGSSEVAGLCKSADALLLWDASKFYQLPNALLSLHKVRIVDKNYYWVTEARNYVWTYNSTIPRDDMDALTKQAMKNHDSLMAEAGKLKKAYVFGTGPSVTEALNFDFSDGFRVVANTIINDPRLTAHIRPHADVFGDFVYHVGPSKYAAKFRKQLARQCRKGCYAVCRNDVMPLMVAHYPEMRERIISIPIKLFVGPNILSRERFYVKLSNNSLVGWMLPLASASAQNIYILGCDGRKPGDKMFWGHAKTTHYDDLTKTLVQTHPSAFNKTDYQSFSSQYERDAEELISHGESLGKKYVSLTKSYIPVLQKRYGKKESD